MVHDFAQLTNSFSSSQVLALLVVAMGVGFLVIVSLAGIIVPAFAGALRHRLDASLKHKMVDRGMTAEEIVKVLNGASTSRPSREYPCASEAVVELDGEWQPALVLRSQDDRYFVHFVGHDMSENQWVTADRMRFPATARNGNAWDCAFSGGLLDASQWCANSKSKPEPVETDL
jgi:hypothetical protein